MLSTNFSRFFIGLCFVFVLSACGGGEDIAVVEPPTQRPTAQPSITPKPTFTPWPTRTPTPTATPTTDPRAAFITPETEVQMLPSPEPLINFGDGEGLPSLRGSGSETGEEADIDVSDEQSSVLFAGLEATPLTATPADEPTETVEATATATPTPSPEPSATETAVATQVTALNTPGFVPTNAPDCYNFLQFVDDVTIPDGEEIAADNSFTKTWRVENLGTCYISDAYTLIPLNDTMEIVEIFPSPLIGPDEEGNLSVTLRAPTEPGRYVMSWQVIEENAGEDPFGQLYLEIVVTE